MKKFRLELQDVESLKVKTIFVEANNILEAVKIIQNENDKLVNIWEVPNTVT